MEEWLISFFILQRKACFSKTTDLNARMVVVTLTRISAGLRRRQGGWSTIWQVYFFLYHPTLPIVTLSLTPITIVFLLPEICSFIYPCASMVLRAWLLVQYSYLCFHRIFTNKLQPHFKASATLSCSMNLSGPTKIHFSYTLKSL